MVKRKIIKIDDEKCNGCGLCIPNCPEGALQMIDGKARLISDLFCDGLGACIGHCPQGAITFEEREAESYDERKVMENIMRAGPNTIKAHLVHLKEHGETKFFEEAIAVLEENDIDIPDLEDEKMHTHQGCPGAAMREFKQKSGSSNPENNSEQASALTQWPIQLHLVPAHAPFLENNHLLVAADCVPFSTPNFHSKLLHGKKLVIGCPKLDDTDTYKEKLTEMFKNTKIKSITVGIMEVPCCHGLYSIVKEAVEDSGSDIPVIKEVVSIQGDIQ